MEGVRQNAGRARLRLLFTVGSPRAKIALQIALVGRLFWERERRAGRSIPTTRSELLHKSMSLFILKHSRRLA